MRISSQFTLSGLLLAIGLTGCGGSFQSEEAARALIEKEDAAMDIEAETAEEQADAE
jgi:hypothetical protein